MVKVNTAKVREKHYGTMNDKARMDKIHFNLNV